MRPSDITLDAALAALGEVPFLGAPVCDSALAAAVFDLAPVADELIVFDALDAALAPVPLPADFDIAIPPFKISLLPSDKLGAILAVLRRNVKYANSITVAIVLQTFTLLTLLHL